MATYSTISPNPITSNAVMVMTPLSNPSLTLTPLLPVGADSIKIRITGITYSISPTTSGNIIALSGVSISISPSTFPFPADGTTAEDTSQPTNYHRYSPTCTINITGGYPLSIFDQNSILSIPKGGSDKTDTVKNVASFSALNAGQDTVFKYHADTRLFTVTYTIAYEVRAYTSLPTPTYQYFTETINVTQQVENDYNNGATLLLNYI